MRGRVWKFGDNIDTDIIIPARYLAYTDPKVLGEHCMEPLAPDFAKSARKGDIIVAGSNFGCGSSREHAPIAILAVGISVVIAKSFARIFYRNAFNQALGLLEADIYEAVSAGETIEVDLATGLIKTARGDVQAKPIPSFMLELISEGGLINHRRHRRRRQ